MVCDFLTNFDKIIFKNLDSMPDAEVTLPFQIAALPPPSGIQRG